MCASSANCSDLVTYVYAQSPEYYNDFQAISVEEQNAQENTLLQTKKEELNAAYSDTLREINGLAQTLRSN